LEVFKFGVYVFLPVLVLFHYGKPEWYAQNVLPYKERFWPTDARVQRTFPTDQSALKEKLAEIKEQKLKRKEERRQSQAEGTSVWPS